MFPFQRRNNSSLNLGENYRHTNEGVLVPNKSASNPLWILSRSLYRSKTISLANVSANRRAAAIQLELAGWTPFRQTAHYVMPQGAGSGIDTHAWLFAWDREAVDNAQAEHGAASLDLVVIPESALRAFSLAIGNEQQISSHACLDGVEALVTRNGVVTDCQWWPSAPNQAVWMNFQRAAGIDTVARTNAFPELTATPWLARPLGYARGKANAPDALRETWIVAITALLLAIPTIWFLNDYRRHAEALSQAEARLANTEQELNGLLSSRGNALGSLVRVAKFDAAFNQTDALALFADVSRLLGALVKPGTMVLTEWDLRDDGGGGRTDVRSKRLKMIFVVSGTAPAATTLVKAFEANPNFRDVQVDAEGARIAIELRVERAEPNRTDLSSPPTPSAASPSTTIPATSIPTAKVKS